MHCACTERLDNASCMHRKTCIEVQVLSPGLQPLGCLSQAPGLELGRCRIYKCVVVPGGRAGIASLVPPRANTPCMVHAAGKDKQPGAAALWQSPATVAALGGLLADGVNESSPEAVQVSS